jgi:dTDP-4-amino-4,6-dideoxygalactose transaminase
MVTLGDETLDRNLRALRLHGGFTKYVHEWVGWNSRLDALQAAVLSVKLKYLDQWTAARQRNADQYRALIPASKAIVPPIASHSTRHVHNQFVIRSARRDALREHLTANGVGTEIYYPIPLHLQKCFEGLGYKPGDFPESERAARETLALPVYPELPAADIERIAEWIRNF